MVLYGQSPVVAAAIRHALAAVGRTCVIVEPTDCVCPPASLLVVDADRLDDPIGICAGLHEQVPRPRTVLHSTTADEDLLRRAMKVGVEGYFTSLETPDVATVASCVERVLAGDLVVPPSMLGSLLRGLIDDRREEDVVIQRFASLSNRERDVLWGPLPACPHRRLPTTCTYRSTPCAAT